MNFHWAPVRIADREKSGLFTADSKPVPDIGYRPRRLLQIDSKSLLRLMSGSVYQSTYPKSEEKKNKERKKKCSFLCHFSFGAQDRYMKQNKYKKKKTTPLTLCDRPLVLSLSPPSFSSLSLPPPPPQWGAADAEIKVPSGENTELKRSPFKAWSRSVYSRTCYAYCQGFLPCLFLPFQSNHLHFPQNSPDFFLYWLWLTSVPV